MSAPSPAFIVPDPEPLTSSVFPYGVNSIDLQWLASFAGLVPLVALQEPPPLPVIPHRYQ